MMHTRWQQSQAAGFACARAGQFFIVHTIRHFGALVFAAVMTTRQFLSILVSSLVFGNPLSAGQWCAASLP
jgi:adenosine 3'-phospho 5'-phosphosulfate transporter B2